ncbi:DUF6838 family protein [Lacrimispora sp.]|uniref:phage tail terminator family protein n=1 Tax=Lacrimispora sp. TaxID=2719234 RepID=UPI0039E6A48D
MINDVYIGILEECKAVNDNTAFYRDNTPPDFTPPAFLAELIDFSSQRSINGKQKVSAQFDLKYFPDGEPREYKNKCIQMQEELSRHFRVLEGGFYIKDRSFKVTDDTLHFQFTVKYTEAMVTGETPMQELETNTNFKED